MHTKHYKTPFILPIAAFFLTIMGGAVLLSLPFAAAQEPIDFIDALFIATSAVCVTGLASIDVFSSFSQGGQVVVLVLVQLGGIGVITYSTLVFYLLGKKISLRDRLAIRQGLLSDPTFRLGTFLIKMVSTIFILEVAGALFLYWQEPEKIGLFNAIFLSISAFCNAGFAPWADNLEQFNNDWAVTSCIMVLIVFGGLGYFILQDCYRFLSHKTRAAIKKLFRKTPSYEPLSDNPNPPVKLTYFSKVALSTTIFLIVGGALSVFITEWSNPSWEPSSFSERGLMALFLSVTSRTAGFSNTNLAHLSDVTLLITICLMFIGGCPGSCAGGIKTTTFRVLLGSALAQIRHRKQIIVQGKAIENSSYYKALLLFFCALLIIVLATLLLVISENGATPHNASPVLFLDIVVEVVSAFGTVGLSVNLTPNLSATGKCILCCVMFIGRLGPIWLITAIQQFQKEATFRYPETPIPVG